MTHPWAQWLTATTPLRNATRGYIPHTDYRIITISGPDALTFLQGQCTCDFTPLSQQNLWRYSAHCNPKGRMISSFTCAAIAADTFGLRVHQSIAQQAADALKKYIVFSKAQCTLSEYLSVGIAGETIGQLGFNAEPGQTQSSEAGLYLAHTTNLGELWLTPEQAKALLAPIDPIHFIAPEYWQQRMIEQGIAEVTASTSEQYLPQAFNYDAINAVSFKKGCYTGQEIIARLHYKGQSKQRLHLLASSKPAAHLNAALINAESKTIGHVINAVATPTGSLQLVCSSAYTGDEVVQLSDDPTATLTPVALPYAIP